MTTRTLNDLPSEVGMATALDIETVPLGGRLYDAQAIRALDIGSKAALTTGLDHLYQIIKEQEEADIAESL